MRANKDRPNRHVFKSVHHPEGAPAALVYGHALARPLLFCAVPVMLGALAAVLRGLPALSYLLFGLPAAIVVAVAWSHFWLGRTLAEVHVRPDAAAARTVVNCLRAERLDWKRVLDLRDAETAIQVSIGREAYTLHHDEWPEHEALLEALKEARHFTRSRA